MGNSLAISFGDLRVIPGDAEPRVHDLRLAERLGFERPTNIRALIKRYATELERYGSLHQVSATPTSGGPLASEYWLTEGQAILICMRSNTDRAADVRAELIAIFQAWRRGELIQPSNLPTITGALRDFFVPAVEGLREEIRDVKKEVIKEVKAVAGNVLILATKGRREPTAETRRIHSQVIRYHYYGKCPCLKCHNVITDETEFLGDGVMEYHHQFGPYDNRPSATIPMAKECHRKITNDLDARKIFDAEAFPQFQRLLSRMPQTQTSMDSLW